MNRNKRILSTLILGLLLFIVFIFGMGDGKGIASPVDNAQASSGNVGSSEISVHFLATGETNASQAWTEEEILSAQPYPLERMPGEPVISLESAIPEGDPLLIPGSPPQGSEQMIVADDQSFKMSPAAPLGTIEHPPYLRYENFDSYTQYPYSTVGVLYFRQYGVGYRCSAASIGNNAIWTAGHCTHAGDGKVAGRSTDIVFIPAFKVDDSTNLTTPFGVWQASAVLTHQEWEMNKDLRYDFGGIILNLNGGKKISEIVGSLGFAANLENNRHWFNIGYPAAPPFDGTRQQICAAPFAFYDNPTNTDTQEDLTVGIGCDMTGGSSGGPWIYQFSGKAGSANYLNGNNSYRYSELPEEMYSPYFGDAAQNLRDTLISLPSP